MNFVERLQQKETERQNSIEANDNVGAEMQEDAVSSDFFGTDSLRNLPPNIVYHLKEGRKRALPYFSVLDIIHNSPDEIEIVMTTKKVKITGRNLGLLFDHLARFRVRYIKVHNGTDGGVDGDLFVKDILIEDS